MRVQRAPVGTNPRNVQCLQGPTELSLTAAAVGVRVVNAKHADLVAVKRQKTSMAFKVCAGGVEIGERGLAVDKAKHHQPDGCVIDIHQQRACGTATLEPVMIAAINLNQCTGAGPSITGLMDFRRPKLTWDP